MAGYDRRDASETGQVYNFVSPFAELNAGLWSLFAGATALLALRIWVKVTRRYGLWYDDYILLACWIILLANNSLIVHEFATGYILKDSSMKWDDRMLILIQISSCGTLVGQALTKTAFAVTLLRMGRRWQKAFLWFCIITMNAFMVAKVVFQWAKICDKSNYQQWYRLDFCIGAKFREDFKEGGNIYNIIMDFIFASFPWLITRTLEIRRIEKIGLCLTMSLGWIVAIVSAIRVAWKDYGNERDSYYIYRNGLSQIWYSSEVAGTIMVQCIPLLRPLVLDMHKTWTSARRDSSVWDPSKRESSATSHRSTTSGATMTTLMTSGSNREKKQQPERFAFVPPPPIYEDDRATLQTSSSTYSVDQYGIADDGSHQHRPQQHQHRHISLDPWVLPRSYSHQSAEVSPLRFHHASSDTSRMYSVLDWDVESYAGTGLSPPPRKIEIGTAL